MEERKARNQAVEHITAVVKMSAGDKADEIMAPKTEDPDPTTCYSENLSSLNFDCYREMISVYEVGHCKIMYGEDQDSLKHCVADTCWYCRTSAASSPTSLFSLPASWQRCARLVLSHRLLQSMQRLFAPSKLYRLTSTATQVQSNIYFHQ